MLESMSIWCQKNPEHRRHENDTMSIWCRNNAVKLRRGNENKMPVSSSLPRQEWLCISDINGAHGVAVV